MNKPPSRATRWLGRSYIYLDSCGSTNDEAYRLALGGAEAGTIVITDHQHSGRGRQGRVWYSPAGENLCFSLILRPRFSPQIFSLLGLAGAVALTEAIEEFVTLRCSIKWPNDVLLANRKVAGILLENRADDQNNRILILGIGLNVNTQSFPSEIAEQCTSLARESGQPLSRSELLATLLFRLEQWLEKLEETQVAQLLKAWRARAKFFGEQIVLQLASNEAVQGQFVNIEEDGALLLRLANGELRKYHSGEVFMGPRAVFTNDASLEA